MDIGPAVEEALLPLRLQACGLVVRKADSVLKEVDAALQHVHQEHNHSRKAIKRFVQANAVPQNRQAFSICKDVHDQGLA
ncbi:TPA: hypothetical protein ACH3X1_011223, partial [Trebouxia sp. C0004]